MGKFRINGGIPLFGTVRVSGSKNAALPVIFATLIARGVSVIENVPDIGDVRVALKIIEGLGAKISLNADTAIIDTSELEYSVPPLELTSSLRASTYLLGSSLARFGRVEICPFGGCNFSLRPIDMHLDAVRSFGGEISGLEISAKGLSAADISFGKRSVGATVNSLLLAAACNGKSTIRGAAIEPHIMTLIDFLRSLGAKIENSGDTLTVTGGALHGGRVRLGGDMIEAGSYIAASLITGGRVCIVGADPFELTAFISALSSGGAVISADNGMLVAERAPSAYVTLTAAPYPGFPTDLQPIVAPLLYRYGGRITDTVWQDRFGYLLSLSRFGIASRRIGNSADIFPSELRPATVTAPDLRGGMALVLSALATDGVSEIEGAETILRGYSSLAEKLSALGAEIECSEM